MRQQIMKTKAVKFITVKEMIVVLSKFDSNDIIIIPEDNMAENGSPLCEITNDMLYVADNSWSGELYIRELTSENIEEGFTTKDLYQWKPGDTPGKKCVVLWPIH